MNEKLYDVVVSRIVHEFDICTFRYKSIPMSVAESTGRELFSMNLFRSIQVLQEGTDNLVIKWEKKDSRKK